MRKDCDNLCINVVGDIVGFGAHPTKENGPISYLDFLELPTEERNQIEIELRKKRLITLYQHKALAVQTAIDNLRKYELRISQEREIIKLLKGQ